jgi:tRNA A-37 threonylcarbamoyl transferase component Bud32
MNDPNDTEATRGPNPVPAAKPVGDAHQTTAQPRASGSLPSLPAGAQGAPLTIPNYDMLPEIARGGMGVVYRARDRVFRREVAVKVMLPGQRVSAFVREARITARLPHPGIPPVYAMGQLPDGRPYLAMKLIKGETLDAVLKRRTDLSADRGRLLAAFEQMCQAVGYAHAQGLIHRDLKPANIMVGAFGEVQVMDWGLAKEIGAAEERTGVMAAAGHDTAATLAGQVKGTPAYMAPEQARGENVDARADVFALGGILAAVLTGRPPFVGNTVMDTIIRAAQAELTNTFDRLDESGADPELIALCKRCLAPHPDARFLDGTAVAWAIARYRSDVEERLRQAERERAAEEARAQEEENTRREKEAKAEEARKRKRTQWALAATAVLLLAAGAVGVALASLYSTASAERDTATGARKDAEKATKDALNQKKIAETATTTAKTAQLATERARAAQAAQADDLVDVLNGLFRSSDPLATFFGEGASQFGLSAPSEGHAATLRPVLLNAAAKFRDRLTDPDPAVALARAKLLTSVGNGMRTLAMYPEAREALSEALALRRKHLKETDLELWQGELALSQCEAESGDLLGCLERTRRVRAGRARGVVPEELALTAAMFEGLTLSILGDPSCVPVLREVARERVRLPGPDYKDAILTKMALISALIEHGNGGGELLPVFLELRGDVSKITDTRARTICELIISAQTKIALGVANASTPSAAKVAAEGLKAELLKLEKLLGDDNVVLFVLRYELARLHFHSGDMVAGDAILVRVLADTRRTVGLAHPRALFLLHGQIERHLATGRAAEARELIAEFESANVKRFGPDNPWLATILIHRLELDLPAKRVAESQKDLERVADLVRKGKFLPTRAGVTSLSDLLAGTDAIPALKKTCNELRILVRPLVEQAHGRASGSALTMMHAEALALVSAGDRVKAAELITDARGRFALNDKLPALTRAGILYTATELELARADFPEALAVINDLRAALAIFKTISDTHAYGIGLMEANAHIGGTDFAAAVPPLLDARRAAVKLNMPVRELALLDMRAAECQLLAGERDKYRDAVTKLLAAHEKATELDVLVRLAWAAALDPQPGGDWDAKAFETRFATAFQPNTNFAWDYRALALVRIRAGKLKEAEDALNRASKNPSPQDPLLHGLLAAARGDKATAKALLAKAEEQLAARAPTVEKPFSYANHPWYEETGTLLLHRELQAAVK